MILADHLAELKKNKTHKIVMEKKILLYYPAPSALSPKTGYLPLALLSMVGLLDKEGYKITIVNYDDEKKKEKLLEGAKNAICVGFSAMTGYQIEDGLNMAKLIRANYPSLKFVWGGGHPSILPEQTLQNPYVDIVVTGLSERAFYHLATTLYNGAELAKVPGISYKVNNKIRHNPPAPLEDINLSPRLPFHLVDVNKYVAATEYGNRTISYYTSVGCPYRCGFCAITKMSNRLWKALAPERVLSDLKYLKENYHIDSVKIVDGDFFIDFARSKEILKGIKELGIKAGFMSLRADQAVKMDHELWELCSETVKGMVIGLESGKQEDLDLMSKGTTVEQNYEAVRLAKKYNVDIILPLIIGLPKEGRKEQMKIEFEYMLDYILELYDIYPSSRFFMFIYNPYPGTPLYEKAKSLGFKEPQTFEEWANFSLHDSNIPWSDPEIAKLVDELSFYYLTIINRVVSEKIKRMGFPFNPLLLPINYLMKKDVLFRMRNKLFRFPIEAIVFKKITYFLASNEAN